MEVPVLPVGRDVAVGPARKRTGRVGFTQNSHPILKSIMVGEEMSTRRLRK